MEAARAPILRQSGGTHVSVLKRAIMRKAQLASTILCPGASNECLAHLRPLGVGQGRPEVRRKSPLPLGGAEEGLPLGVTVWDRGGHGRGRG